MMRKVCCLSIVGLLLISLLAGCSTGKSINVNQSLDFNLANQLQFNNYIPLTAFEGKLYFYSYESVDSKHANTLSVFFDGTINTLEEFEDISYITFLNEYMYYSRYNDAEKMKKDVYCYSLKTHKETYLTTVDFFYADSVHVFSDGTIYIPTDFLEGTEKELTEYCVVSGDRIEGTVLTEVTYPLNDKLYTIKGNSRKDLFCVCNGERQNMKNEVTYGNKSLIPCDKGLLVYNDNGGNLLYLIDETGKVQNLFEVECMSTVSAINLYEDFVFLSFTRYEKYGEFGRVGYENDIIQGTYRIDLNDGSSTKISDEMYRGLYIWGENVIYAVDFEDQIFQLDFDGDCIEQLL